MIKNYLYQFLMKGCLHFENLLFLATSPSKMLPLTLDDPTHETIKNETYDHHMPKE
jgi:hypothetical protein